MTAPLVDDRLARIARGLRRPNRTDAERHALVWARVDGRSVSARLWHWPDDDCHHGQGRLAKILLPSGAFLRVKPEDVTLQPRPSLAPLDAWDRATRDQETADRWYA